MKNEVTGVTAGPANQHDKRREYWFPEDFDYTRIDGVWVEPQTKSLHLREVLPGEITINKEEFRHFLIQLTTMHKNAIDHMVDEYFCNASPEGTSDT